MIDVKGCAVECDGCCTHEEWTDIRGISEIVHALIQAGWNLEKDQGTWLTFCPFCMEEVLVEEEL